MSAVALIDTVAHPVALDFYQLFPVEVVQPAPESMRIDRVRRVDGMTWQSLLIAIRQHVPDGGEVLIVSHGTSRGIFIPLYEGGPPLDAEELYDLASSMIFPPEQMARRFNLSSVDRVREFRQALSEVAAKRLRRIELRACNVGALQRTMERIRSLLNVDYFGCPNARDSFFGMRPTQVRPNGTSIDQWQAAHPGTQDVPMTWAQWQSIYPQGRYLYQTSHGDVSLFYHEIPGRRLECELAAERSEAVFAWVRQKIPGGHWQGGLLPLHAFVAAPPAFAGEAGYLSRLRCVMRPRPQAP